MRIGDFRLESDGNTATASAAVEWEDCARLPARIRFAARGAYRDEFRPTPESFVLSAALSAARAGERRLRVDERLCPVLAEGLREALALLDSWYDGRRSSMAIEAAKGFRAQPRGAPVAAFFLSGGVDSLHLLRQNRLRLPRSHSGSFRAAIHLPGFGIAGEVNARAAENLAVRSLGAASRIARAEDLGLALVETDARLLDADHPFFVLESHASLLAAAAHAYPGAFRSVSIAASADLLRSFRAWGSHPMLDPCFGSASLAIRHTGHELARIEKVAELSRWDLALETLLVCNEAPLPHGIINCGRCEKCVRTRLEIRAAGSSRRAATFPPGDVTAGSIRRLGMPAADPTRLPGGQFRFPPSWSDLREAYRGDPDIVAAMDEYRERLKAAARWQADHGWKGWARRMDRALFGGRLLALRRRWSGS
jgi:hypothetical protein